MAFLLDTVVFNGLTDKLISEGIGRCSELTSTMYHLIENVNTEITVPDDGIISRTVFQDEHLKAVLFGFSSGQELSEHTASMPGIMHFIRGSANITVGTDSRKASDNLWVYMQPNVPHSIVAETEVVMLLLLIKAAKKAAA